MFGFLNIYKPVGMTSHDVVAVLRKKLKTKQIGHTGTLDPFAEGVLPIAIGKATRLIEYLPDDKEYLATVQFGKSTNTYDIEGETTFESDKKICEQEIIEKLKDFKGEIEQFPPIYSAIKVKGKKLYEYARKGEDVEIQPRKVTIYNIELKSFDFELQQAQILVKCSKGTYIRSIANDLGKVLGCGGHLIRLVRTQAGKFRIEDSLKLKVESGKFFIVESGKWKVESLLSHAPSPDGEGWDGVISTDNSETSQAQQTDNLAHPPLEGGSKSLISGSGNVNYKNLSNDNSPSPQPPPSRGEGACYDSHSNIQPFNCSTDNSTLSLTLPLGEGTCLDSLSTLEILNQKQPHPNPPHQGEGTCLDSLSTLETLNQKQPHPNPPHQGEGTCHDSLSTFNFPLSTFHFQLINPLEVLDLPIVEIDNDDFEKVRNGISINLKDSSQFTVHCSQIVLLLYNKEKICAIGQIENDKIKLKKVFL